MSIPSSKSPRVFLVIFFPVSVSFAALKAAVTGANAVLNVVSSPPAIPFAPAQIISDLEENSQLPSFASAVFALSTPCTSPPTTPASAFVGTVNTFAHPPKVASTFFRSLSKFAQKFS
nr:MAG TPA: hypothetical protein [Caudoviricetes sp.]